MNFITRKDVLLDFVSNERLLILKTHSLVLCARCQPKLYRFIDAAIVSMNSYGSTSDHVLVATGETLQWLLEIKALTGVISW